MVDGIVRPSQSNAISAEDIKVMERCCGKPQTWIRRTSKKANQSNHSTSSAALHPQTSHASHVDIDQRAPLPIPRLPQAHEKRPVGWEPQTSFATHQVAGPSAMPTAEFPPVPSLSSSSESTVYSEEIPRYPSVGGWSHDAYGQSFDPTWTNFIQQLGF